MRYLVYALLLATMICTISNCHSIHLPPIKPHGLNGNGGVSVPLVQYQNEWKNLLDELIPLFLASFSFILLPVLAGYFTFRLSFTYHRFLLTIIGLFILAVAVILMTGFFDVQIRWEKLWSALGFLQTLFMKIGWVRTVALILGAYFGIRAYLNDRRV